MGIGGGEFWKLKVNYFIIEEIKKIISPLNLKTLLDYPIDNIVKIYHHLVKSVQFFLFFASISKIEHFHPLVKFVYMANIHYILMNFIP